MCSLSSTEGPTAHCPLGLPVGALAVPLRAAALASFEWMSFLWGAPVALWVRTAQPAVVEGGGVSVLVVGVVVLVVLLLFWWCWWRVRYAWV